MKHHILQLKTYQTKEDSLFAFPQQLTEAVSVVDSISTQTSFSHAHSPVYLPSDVDCQDNALLKPFIDSDNLKLQTTDLNSKINSLNDKIHN